MDDELRGCGRVLLFLAIGLPIGYVTIWVVGLLGMGLGLSNNAAGSLGLVAGALAFWYAPRIIRRWLRDLGSRERPQRLQREDEELE